MSTLPIKVSIDPLRGLANAKLQKICEIGNQIGVYLQLLLRECCEKLLLLIYDWLKCEWKGWTVRA